MVEVPGLVLGLVMNVDGYDYGRDDADDADDDDAFPPTSPIPYTHPRFFRSFF